MPRKGSRKVRTGCLTCKSRKVKCDEEKPHCKRCINTGRECGGYPTKITSGLLWHRPRQLFQGIENTDEGRALQYFCERTAQVLSGTADPYFWTHLVMQFSNFEPAVRHSVVAISSLYEQFQSETEGHSGVQLKSNSLALQHYNAAIRELKTTDNQPLVILVCILFICIEFLQSNKEVAIQHCKHGISLLSHVNYSWAKEHLAPVFRRLSVFPFFFGHGNADFPDLVSVDDPLPPSFDSWAEAHSAMDSLFSRVLRLVRMADAYRFGNLRYKTVPTRLLAEQAEINHLLDEWKKLFNTLNVKSTPLSDSPDDMETDPTQLISRAILSGRFEICRVWLNIAFEADDMCFDLYLNEYRRILESCSILSSKTLNTSRNVSAKRKPRFIFETGFMPILHGVASKCRNLKMRLEALDLLRKLGTPRENLWEMGQIYAVARRVVEIEHGVLLDSQGEPTATPSHEDFPPDERRVRFTIIELKAAIHIDLDGKETCGWTVRFVMRDSEDKVVVTTEFVTP
ncbi:hypothetical protein M426DRAFT_319813 [Hypoxylon sp. CI-4A]|nr:hypothetical protein M426DRAFT_319813 [Hypoxylon sp. CI-4A]